MISGCKATAGEVACTHTCSCSPVRSAAHAALKAAAAASRSASALPCSASLCNRQGQAGAAGWAGACQGSPSSDTRAEPLQPNSQTEQQLVSTLQAATSNLRRQCTKCAVLCCAALGMRCPARTCPPLPAAGMPAASLPLLPLPWRPPDPPEPPQAPPVPRLHLPALRPAPSEALAARPPVAALRPPPALLQLVLPLWVLPPADPAPPTGRRARPPTAAGPRPARAAAPLPQPPEGAALRRHHKPVHR